MMNIETKIALKKIISLFSIDIIYDVRKFCAVMKDCCIPKIDINLLIDVMTAQNFRDFIMDVIDKNDFNEYKKKKLLLDLVSDYPIKKDDLEQGIDAFLFSIGIDSSKNKSDNDAENILIANVIKQMLSDL